MTVPVEINAPVVTVGGVNPPDVVLGAGSNRVLFYWPLFGGTPLITGVTYGGVAMTLLTSIENNNNAKNYCFYMLEAELATAVGNAFVVSSSPSTGSGIPNHITIAYSDALQSITEFGQGLYLNTDPQPYTADIQGVIDSIGLGTIIDQGSTSSFTYNNGWSDRGQANNSSANAGVGLAIKLLGGGAEQYSVNVTNGNTRKSLIACRLESAVAITPVLSSPTDAANGSTASTGSVVSDTTSGNIFAVVTQSATTPTSQQIMDGEDHLDAVADSANIVPANAGINNIAFSGLVEATAYWTHYTQDGTPAATPVSASGFSTSTNQAPVLDTPIPDQVCTVGIAFGPLDVSGNFSDPNGDPLTFTEVGLPNGLVISSAGVISGTPTGGFSPGAVIMQSP